MTRSDRPTARRSCRPSAGEALECRKLEPKMHTTKAPNRYSEAALTERSKKRERPAQHVRVDHRDDSGTKLRLQTQRGAGSHWVVLRLPVARDPPARPGRLHLYRTDEEELDAIPRRRNGPLDFFPIYFGNDHRV